jgi:hypothetical protein
MIRDFGSFDCVLNHEDSLLQLLSEELPLLLREHANGAILSENRDWEVQVRHTGTERRFCNVEEFRDVLLVPRFHLREKPVFPVDVLQLMRRVGVVAEEIVRFAAHNDEIRSLSLRELRGALDLVEQALESLVVLGRVRVTGCCHDRDSDVLAEESDDSEDDGVIVGETLAVVVERDVSIEGDELDTSVADKT